MTDIFIYDALELYMSPIYISMIISITVAFLWVPLRMPHHLESCFKAISYKLGETGKEIYQYSGNYIFSQILLSVKKQLYPPDDEEGSSKVTFYTY